MERPNKGWGSKDELEALGKPDPPPFPKPSFSLTTVYQSAFCGWGLGGIRPAGGPDGDAAVGDPRAVPAGPVVGVHAAVLKPDVADAGRVVGEGVGDLGGGRWRQGVRSGELTFEDSPA